MERAAADGCVGHAAGKEAAAGPVQPVRSGGGGDARPLLRSVPAASRPPPPRSAQEGALCCGSGSSLLPQESLQAPACPCSHGMSPVGVAAPGVGWAAAAAEPSLTRVVPPSSLLLVTHCCLAQPPGSASLGFCFPLCLRGKLEQHPCSASSCAEKPEPFPLLGPGIVQEYGRPVWEAAFALPPATCCALGWDFSILGQSQRGLWHWIMSLCFGHCPEPEALTNDML